MNEDNYGFRFAILPRNGIRVLPAQCRFKCCCGRECPRAEAVKSQI